MKKLFALLPLFLLAATLAALPVPVRAQGAIQQSGSAATGHALCFVTNGIARDCGFVPAPAVSGSCTLRVISGGTSDIALVTDCAILWNSASAAGKTEFLYPCNSATKGFSLVITDAYGSGGDFPIALSTGGGNTINNAASFAIGFNRESQNLVCDGSGNWVLQ